MPVQLAGTAGTPQGVDFHASPEQLRQVGNAAPQRGNRSLQNDGEQQERRNERGQWHAAAAQVAAQSKTEETRHQYEILEVGKNPDVGRHPSDHQHFCEEAEQADQDRWHPAEATEVFHLDFEPARSSGGAEPPENAVHQND